MKKISIIFSILILAFTSCTTIHEFPEGEGVDPSLINVDLSLSINMSIDQDNIIQTYQNMLASDYDVRYIVDIYKEAPSYAETIGSFVQRIVKTESVIIESGIYKINERIALHAGIYNIMVWVDFVKKGTDKDLYYNTENLFEVKINKINGEYHGYNVTKDAFTAMKQIDLTPYAHDRFVEYEVVASVERPFAVYQVITTDIDKYAEKFESYSYSEIKPSNVTVAYQNYFPMGFNVYYSVPDNLLTGIGYEYSVIDGESPKEAILASDFVFVKKDKSDFYFIDFEVKDPNERHINTIKDLKINLYRNKMTIIKGDFLTKDINDGEVGIDPGFDDEIVVPIG